MTSKDIEVREVICKMDNGLVFVNEFWTCPECSEESNSVEWFWKGKQLEEGGYQVTSFCPKCKTAHESVI